MFHHFCYELKSHIFTCVRDQTADASGSRADKASPFSLLPSLFYFLNIQSPIKGNTITISQPFFLIAPAAPSSMLLHFLLKVKLFFLWNDLCHLRADKSSNLWKHFILFIFSENIWWWCGCSAWMVIELYRSGNQLLWCLNKLWSFLLSWSWPLGIACYSVWNNTSPNDLCVIAALITIRVVKYTFPGLTFGSSLEYNPCRKVKNDRP